MDSRFRGNDGGFFAGMTGVFLVFGGNFAVFFAEFRRFFAEFRRLFLFLPNPPVFLRIRAGCVILSQIFLIRGEST